MYTKPSSHCCPLLTKEKSSPLATGGRKKRERKKLPVLSSRAKALRAQCIARTSLPLSQRKRPRWGGAGALTLIMLLLRGMPGLPSRCWLAENPLSLLLLSGLAGGADPGSSPAPGWAQSPLETRLPALSKRDLPPPPPPPPSPSPALNATLPWTGPGEEGSPPPPVPPPLPNSAISLPGYGRSTAAAPLPSSRGRSAVPLLPLSLYLRSGDFEPKSLPPAHLAAEAA